MKSSKLLIRLCLSRGSSRRRNPNPPPTLASPPARTLQSVVTLITRDLQIDWIGEPPSWWPKDVIFLTPRNPRKVPATCKGTWCALLRKVIRAGYQHTGTNVDTEEVEIEDEESDMDTDDAVEKESGGFCRIHQLHT